LVQFFSEKLYLMKVIVHSLKGIFFLNQQGLSHGDINCSNILIVMDNSESPPEN